MKSMVIASSVVAVAAAGNTRGTNWLALRSSLSRSVGLVSEVALRSPAHYGDTKCPCIGFDNIDGETTVIFEDGKKAAYPADLGARCEMWDDKRHPACKEGETPGPGNGWCGQAWCFVDSCDCDIPVMPKQSEYVPDARYHGRPLFYSYATCGGEDMWSKELPEVGTPGCRCVGFDGVPGTTEVVVKGFGAKFGRVVEYPAEIGGSCKAWDHGMHPECKLPDAPSWCGKRWCYVDPCSCDLKDSKGEEVVPKVTMYLPEATFTGKSLYYSYETCGHEDEFTHVYNREACVNQETERDCKKLTVKSGAAKCGWTGTQCVGAELLNHPLCETFAEKAKKGKDKSSANAVRRPLSLAAVAAFFLAAAQH